MSKAKHWFVIYTQALSEKKVVAALVKKQIQHYCPLNKIRKGASERNKAILEPLFPSFVFVHVTDAEHAEIKRISGVLNLVHWQGKPAIVKDVEIDLMQRFLATHSNVVVERTEVNVEEMVRIINGSLVERDGHVLAVKDKTVKVVLPSLGFILVAESAITNEPLQAEPNKKQQPPENKYAVK